jgi:hypothetical protein
MTKQEVISQVQNSLGSLFTKDDVINCLNMVVEAPKVESKPSYPSKKWLDKIKDSVLESIRETDFNDRDMFDISDCEFDIRHGNTIELDSFEVDACALKVYVENEIENVFGGIEDDIIELQQQNEETEKLFQEEQERLNSNEALKEAMAD